MTHHTGKFHWDYEGHFGPMNWYKVFPLAASKHQSPININTSRAIHEKRLEETPLFINYEKLDLKSVENNGHTFQVIPGEVNASEVIGGPIKNTYKFGQFHFHWGRHDKGSEHTIDNTHYSAEIHFVNWNSEKYETISDATASSQHDGLLVLGVLVKIGKENQELRKIINALNEIQLNGQTSTIFSNLQIRNLFPSDINKYWTYDGSLTTPPCYESVKWIVFKDPIEVSLQQLNAIRTLYKCCNPDECCESNRIKYNYRPICPINERVIYKSF